MINQGDGYLLNINIYNGVEPINIGDVEKIEFAFGKITKTYPDEVKYYENIFQLPLTQQDTFTFERSIPYQVRIKWIDGTVTSSIIQTEKINESISKNIL